MYLKINQKNNTYKPNFARLTYTDLSKLSQDGKDLATEIMGDETFLRFCNHKDAQFLSDVFEGQEKLILVSGDYLTDMIIQSNFSNAMAHVYKNEFITRIKSFAEAVFDLNLGNK